MPTPPPSAQMISIYSLEDDQSIASFQGVCSKNRTRGRLPRQAFGWWRFFGNSRNFQRLCIKVKLLGSNPWYLFFHDWKLYISGLNESIALGVKRPKYTFYGIFHDLSALLIFHNHQDIPYGPILVNESRSATRGEVGIINILLSSSGRSPLLYSDAECIAWESCRLWPCWSRVSPGSGHLYGVWWTFSVVSSADDK